jgi:hypothetical protein
MKKLIPLLLILLIACKKQSGPGISKTDIISSGNWKLISYSAYTITGTTDVYSTYPDCRKDDYLHFNRDGSGEINEGPSKCNSADPQSLFIQWSFTNNTETKIKINGGDYLIDRLDDNNFQIHSISTDPYASQVAKTYSK